MAILDELLVSLGFKFDKKELDNFNKSFGAVKDSILAVVAVAGVATAAIGTLLKTSASATDEITKQARQLNILTGEYDALLHASEITVGSSQAMAGALEKLSVKASEAARGVGSGVEAFGMLGLSVTDANGNLKTTDVLLSQAADALNGLSDQGQRLELADKLGLKEIDLLLRDGSKGIKALTDDAKALGVVTDEDSKAAEAFNDSMTRMFRVIDSIRRNIATALLPQANELIKTFTEWLKANKAIIKQRFESFVKVLSKALTILGKAFNFVLDILGEVTKAVGGLDNVFDLLLITFGLLIGAQILTMFFNLIKLMRTAGTAALLLNAKLLLIPILIGAAIAALALLIEDIITFAKGGDSFLGRMLNDFPEIEKGFNIMKEALTSIWDLVQKIGQGIGEFTGFLVVGTENLINTAGDFFSGLNPFSDEPPSSAGSTNTSTNSTKIDQKNTFNISSNNPEEVATAVQKVVEDMAGTASRNTTSAVDY